MTHESVSPSLFWTLPFALLLLCIAVLPLIPHLSHWWHRNSSKLAVAILLSLVTCGYYLARGRGYHESGPGVSSLGAMLHHAVLGDYVPFMVLLLSLYVISGGIRVVGDFMPTPRTNALVLLLGTLLASFIGTTGVSMLLIRPLLEINKHRKHVKHTVIFFIFLVSNIGGLLLPVGDPPLFLGYLRGVPFLWTIHLIPEWAFCSTVVLVIYFVMDRRFYSMESESDIAVDRAEPVRFQILGMINFAFLVGVVLAVALLVPGKPFPGTSWIIPNIFLREWVQLGLAGLSMLLTSRAIREANDFNFSAILEVAALFIGIFITMQAPVEILQIKGPSLALHDPAQFFWASGVLSSFLDNAPTYAVFFETAGSFPPGDVHNLTGLATATGSISDHLLAALSCGSVFMGANTYIGNGPNFMVKSIAEQYRVRMPGFFGYMLYSGAILIPTFVLVTLIFFR